MGLHLFESYVIHQVKPLSRRIKHYPAKQGYDANFLGLFWRDNVSPGVAAYHTKRNLWTRMFSERLP